MMKVFNKIITIFFIFSLFISCSKNEKISVLKEQNLSEQMTELYEEAYREFLDGDTLFAAGCGRVFEGTFEQMHESLIKLKNLPNNTKIYCGHEYTLSNLEFAKEAEPFNQNILSRYNEVIKLRKKGIPSLPSLLSNELKINPFLRCDNNEVQENISTKFKTLKEPDEIFKALRLWKDNF